MRELIASAIERGDLPPGSDIDFIAEAPAAFLWHHALYDLSIDRDLLERILDLVLPKQHPTE
jgi:hypothetical protein